MCIYTEMENETERSKEIEREKKGTYIGKFKH